MKKIKGYLKRIDWVTLGLQIIAFGFLVAMAKEIFFGLDEEPMEIIQEETEATIVAETPIYEEIETMTEEVEAETTEEIAMDSLELLAQLVEAEAGNQDKVGKRLVVDVVLNRVDSDTFPDTIEEVIFQPYQFSCVLDGGAGESGLPHD